MVRADSNNTTIARRDFLTVAAATLVSGGAVSAAAVDILLPPVEPDPIFAAIEAHKTALARLDAAHETYNGLELGLPGDKRRTVMCFLDDEVNEGDDPRWIENQREVLRGHDACEDQACNLVNVLPTTMAGIVALLKYANEADFQTNGWSSMLAEDEGKGKLRSWHYFLIELVVEALSDLQPSAERAGERA
jgi:hypothetical protein